MKTAKKERTKDSLTHVSRSLQLKSSLVTAEKRDESGITVTAEQDIRKGTKVMDCVASAIALDPNCRFSNCGLCARKHLDLRMCPTCRIIALCPTCASNSEKHDNECHVLREVVNIMSDQIDSAYLLAFRILCLRETKWIDWELYECLQAVAIPDSIDSGIEIICHHLKRLDRMSWLNKNTCREALARVLGCSHALTDITLPLGDQCIGRGIFLEHSFYNHNCTPNAFLSCLFPTEGPLEDSGERGTLGRVHLIRDLKQGEEVTLSYIPTSGLAVQERQQRLKDGFGFACKCEACSNPKLELPTNADVDSIREIQFSCNARLLEQIDAPDTSEIQQVTSLIKMTQRGMENQQIPKLHEVSIEANRLLAIAYTLTGNSKDAVENYNVFFTKTTELGPLFDPVALAAEHLNLSKHLQSDEQLRHQQIGTQLLKSAVGSDHPIISVQRPLKKKQKTTQ